MSTLFGAPLGYTADSLHWWTVALDKAWRSYAGRPPGQLQDDLNELSLVYASGASPKTIRNKLRRLGHLDADLRRLPEAVLLSIGDRGLITPEGRVLLHVLTQMREDGRYVVDAELARDALLIVVDARTEWHRTWLLRQVGGTLSAPAIGAAIFLLVNGSVGRDAAFWMPVREAEDRSLASSVLPVVGAFSQALGGRVPADDSGIRSHWAFTQVSRFLALDVARESTDHGTALFIREGREQHLITDLVLRLGRWEPTTVAVAVLKLVDAYRLVRGRLVTAGVSFEDPTHTQKVVRALTSRPGV